MTRSMTSSTTRPTSSTALAARPTTPRRRSATRRSRWTRARRSARSLTASTRTALKRKSSNIFRWTASTSPGPASCLSSPGWTATTLWTWRTASAAPTSGSGRTICGSSATPPTRATARYCGATRGERTTKFERKGFPLGGSCPRSGLMRGDFPRQPVCGQSRHTRPSSGLASRGHLPPQGKALERFSYEQKNTTYRKIGRQGHQPCQGDPA